MASAFSKLFLYVAVRTNTVNEYCGEKTGQFIESIMYQKDRTYETSSANQRRDTAI